MRSPLNSVVEPGVCLVLFLALLGAGCSYTPALHKDTHTRISALNAHPEDPASRRALASYRDLLQHRLQENPWDPQISFYLGMVHESLDELSEALKIYKQYSEIDAQPERRRIIDGRERYLTYQLARRSLLDTLYSQDPPAETTVGVYPLRFVTDNGDSTFFPLGRGMATLIMNDLTKVDALDVVERIQLQAVVDELRDSTTPWVERATAPRIGLLLRAGTVLGGSFSVTAGEHLQVLPFGWNIVKAQHLPLDGHQTKADLLDELYFAQKAIVFDILGQMNIIPTPEERMAIEAYHPTKNLEAFLEYSRGLLRDDRRDFTAAAVHFRAAALHDPNFSEASEAALLAEQDEWSRKDLDAVLESILEIERGLRQGSLTQARAEQMGASLGLISLLALDPNLGSDLSRQGVSEVAGAEGGPQGIPRPKLPSGILPPPPPPNTPPGNN